MTTMFCRAMQAYLIDFLEKLKRTSLYEIKHFPSYSDKEVIINNKACTLAIWKNERSDGMIEVVAQVYYTGWCYKLFGAGTMTADGFLIDPGGNFLKLPDEIRWKYC